MEISQKEIEFCKLVASASRGVIYYDDRFTFIDKKDRFVGFYFGENSDFMDSSVDFSFNWLDKDGVFVRTNVFFSKNNKIIAIYNWKVGGDPVLNLPINISDINFEVN